MNVNPNPMTALQQAQVQSMIESTLNTDGELTPLMGDVALVVETMATEAAIKRFTPTEEERQQERQREIRDKEDRKKSLESKALDKKRDAAQEEENEQLQEEFAANLVYKA